MSTAIEILTGVRDLLSDPERWTQEAFARDASGAACPTFAEEATCWCVLGAFAKVSFPGSLVTEERETAYGRAYWTVLGLTDRTLTSVNDEQGREALLDLFDKAIGAAA